MPRCWWAAARTCSSPWRWSRRRSASRRPRGLAVERVHRPREARPGEVGKGGRGEARAIDLEDAIGGEELVEAGAEMAAALQHHGARRADIDAEDLELHRILALLAVRDDHDRDATHLQQRRGTHRRGDAFSRAATA